MLDHLEKQLANPVFKGREIDDESVPILRDHKIKFYETQLRQNINRKYKISFYKGI